MVLEMPAPGFQGETGRWGAKFPEPSLIVLLLDCYSKEKTCETTCLVTSEKLVTGASESIWE